MLPEPVLHGSVALFAFGDVEGLSAGMLASTVSRLPSSITRIGFVEAGGEVTDVRPEAPLTARGVDVVDSIKQVRNGCVSADIDRSELAHVALPIFVDRELLHRGLLAAKTSEVHPVVAVAATGVPLVIV